MGNNSNNNGGGMGLGTILFLIFLVLKLTNYIDWSWWWVTSPLWIPFALVLSIFGIVFLGVVIALIFGASVEDIKSKIKIKK